jgi:hypothetical protein
MREVSTLKGNRIDLILVSREWVIAIENKIHHVQNNPFDDYAQSLKKWFPESQGKPVYKAILSPGGTSDRAGWIPVSYSEFVARIQGHLGAQFIQKPYTKWTVFLREFLVHLENVAMESAMKPEQIDFVEKNYPLIGQLRCLQDGYHTLLEQEGTAALQNLFPRATVGTSRSTWPGGPAIHFRLDRWVGESEVVIYVNGTDEGEGVYIKMYADDIGASEAPPPDAIAVGLNYNTEGARFGVWTTKVTAKFTVATVVDRFGELTKSFDIFLQKRALIAPDR